MTDRPGPGPDRVLVLCSANQCRSPLAGAFLQRAVDRRGLAVDVRTAGVHAVAGRPATPGTVAAARTLGVDLRDHESRALDPALLAGADLVLGMERLHVREAVVLDAGVWRRSFTLPDLVRRAEAGGARRPDESLRAWLEFLSAGRDRMALMGASPDDDVRDPTSDRTVDHPGTAAYLDDLAERLVGLAWPGAHPAGYA